MLRWRSRGEAQKPFDFAPADSDGVRSYERRAAFFLRHSSQMP